MNHADFLALKFIPELAKDALKARGYVVTGGYMSPVNDAYKKKVYGALVLTTSDKKYFYYFKEFILNPVTF